MLYQKVFLNSKLLEALKQQSKTIGIYDKMGGKIIT